MSSESERIWLEPKADEYGCEGRTWCDHNAWGDGAVEYVRAEAIATLRAERDDYKADYLRRHADVMTMMNRALIAESRAEAAEASLAEVRKGLEEIATALPFLDRLARALKNKNGGKYSDAWTDDGHTLSGMVSAFRIALARLDTPEKNGQEPFGYVKDGRFVSGEKHAVENLLKWGWTAVYAGPAKGGSDG